MRDIRTLEQLQDELDRQMAWRVKEIGTFQVAAKRSGPERKIFIRAGVALVYAHWEGFIKSSSESYLNFVHHRRHTYRELKSCFAVFGLRGKLQMLSETRQAYASIDAFDFVLAEMESIAYMQMSSAIDTASNLTSKVFINIATSLDIGVEKYSTKFNLIDESLVQRRNKVAHGEHMDLNGEDFGVLVTAILQLMRDYKIDLLNAASMGSYKRSASAATS